MGKYPGYFTTKDVCREEIKECKKILKKYPMSKDDIEIITGMIEQPYYQLSESYQMANALEAYIKDIAGEDAENDFFAKFVTKRKEAGPHLAAFIQKMRDNYEKEVQKLEKFQRIK